MKKLIALKEDTHKNLSMFKALSGSPTLSDAVDNLISTKTRTEEIVLHSPKNKLS